MSKNIAYFYEDGVADYYYGPKHPMKPQRIKLTHHLLLSYGLYRKMEVYEPHLASYEELTRFHSDEYVEFLRKITPFNTQQLTNQMNRFRVGTHSDCPIFDGIYEFCQKYSGASLDAAVRLNHQNNDICINWSGGLHHAKKMESSGFCYVNDIVLAILELLKYYPRVMYIDIDIHHGDGVEEAFYTTNRVMTVSFHKYGNYFPGTGHIDHVGKNDGTNYAVNFPLDDWIDDDTYQSVFRPVVKECVDRFRPAAIVLQCGADSVTGDRLGCFNLSLKGHGQCVDFVKSFNLPLLILGGGGYTIKNVARCWAYETSLILNKEISNIIPQNEFIDAFSPSYCLHLDPDPTKINLNTPELLNEKVVKIMENLKSLEGAPSVPIQRVPPDFSEIADKEISADVRAVDKDGIDQIVEHPNEYYDGEKDNDEL